MEFSPSPKQKQTRQQPLTVENVRSLPLNAKATLYNFVLEQRENARYYARESAYESQLEHRNVVSAALLNSSNPSLTPPLKSRVELRTQTPPRPLEQSIATKSPIKPSRNITNRDRLLHGTPLDRSKGGQTSEKAQVKAKGKKRPLSRSDEEEYQARLAVRRDKKRVKKSILEGKENNQDRAHLHKSHKSTEDKESMNGDDHPTIHRTRKASGKKRIAPGLSLMETFTATNVKTSRLTLKPKNERILSHPKASASVKVVPKADKENVPKKAAYHKGGTQNPKYSNYNHSIMWQKNAHPSERSEPLNQTKPNKFNPNAGVSDASSDLPDDDQFQLEPQGQMVALEGQTGCYSDSWGLGSQLPSDDESVVFVKQKEPPDNNVMSQNSPKPVKTGNTAEDDQSHSELPIKVMNTTWKWHQDSNLGTFSKSSPERRTKQVIQLSPGPQPADSDADPHPQPAHYSRHFPLPLVIEAEQRSPCLAADAASKALLPYELAIDGQVSVITSPSPRPPSVMPDVAPSIHGKLPTPPTLEALLQAYDEDVFFLPTSDSEDDALALLSQPANANDTCDYIPGSVETRPSYKAYEEQDKFQLCYADGITGDFELHHVIDGASPPNFPHGPEEGSTESYPLQDCLDEILGDDYYQDKEPAVFADEAVFEQVIDQSERDRSEFNLSLDAEPDVLSWTKGRSLLFGLDQPMERDNYTRVSGLTPVFIPTYGQSAQEIEVAIGKQLGKYCQT